MVRSFIARELRTVLRNRFLQVFSTLALLAGWAAVGLAPSAAATPFILLQLALYLVPLFAVLIAVSSAHGELEEHPFLFSQPICRFTLVAGKWTALWIASSAVLFLAFLPALLTAPAAAKLFLLWGKSLCLAGIFVGIGLAVGFSTSDRGRGLIYALLIWLLLVIGYDLLAYFAAQFTFVQQSPALWLSFLLANPLDAVRISALFSLEEIPFTVPGENKIVLLWSAHLGKWVLVLSAIWIAALLSWCRFKVERREV